MDYAIIILSVIRFQSFEQYTSIMKNVLCFSTYNQGWGMGSITCKNKTPTVRGLAADNNNKLYTETMIFYRIIIIT